MTRKTSLVDLLTILVISMVAVVGGGFLAFGNGFMPQGGPATVRGFTGTVTVGDVMYTSRGTYAEVTGVSGGPAVIDIPATVGSPALPVTHIRSGAFYDKNTIKSVTIGENIQYVGVNAFDGCSSVETLFWNARYCAPFSEENSDMPFYRFGRNYGTNNPLGLDVIIGNNVLQLPDYFFGNTNLTAKSNIRNVTFSEPSSLKVTGIDAFRMGNFTKVVIPDSVTILSGGTFANCPNLTEVTIGTGVRGIESSVHGRGAFSYSTKVTKLNWNATNCTSISTNFGHPFDSFGTEGGGVSLVFGDNVQSIPSIAFQNRTVIKDITIGAGLTNLDNNAFSGCTGVTSLTWNAVNYPTALPASAEHPFSNFGRNSGTNVGLGLDVTIGDNVKSVPVNFLNVVDAAYRPNVKVVTIGKGVINIGYNAFSGCTNAETLVWNATDYTAAFALYENHPFFGFGISYRAEEGADTDTGAISGVNVLIGNNVKRIPDNFLGLPRHLEQHRPYVTSVTFAEDGSVEYIGQRAFYCLTTLAAISIPDTVTEIRDHAFYNCASLKSVIVPDGITVINNFTFAYCTSMTSVVLPDSVTKLGAFAFHQCVSLPEIKIPDAVTSIGRLAFYNCRSLTSIVIPDGVKNINDFTFAYCASLTNVVIPSSVTQIKEYAFHQCTSLPSIEIPTSVRIIGAFAFYNCTSLASIVIPSRVTAISDFTFAYCTSLTNVVIPSNVTAIGNHAFYRCTSLTVRIPASVISIGFRAFVGVRIV